MKLLLCAVGISLFTVSISAPAEKPALEQPAFGPTQEQVQHMVVIAMLCRVETDFVIRQIKEVARSHGGEALFSLDAPGGVKVMMSEATFSDLYFMNCYPVRAAQDPVLSQASRDSKRAEADTF